MKVIFSLSLEQKLVASRIIAANMAEFDQQCKSEPGNENALWGDDWIHADEHNVGCTISTYHGNLLGYMYNHTFNFNDNQHLHADIDSGRLEYIGERHPLRADGGMEVLEKIAGGDLNSLDVIEYHTSMEQLQWHETLYDWLFRLPFAECVMKALDLGYSPTEALIHQIEFYSTERGWDDDINSLLSTYTKSYAAVNACYHSLDPERLLFYRLEKAGSAKYESKKDLADQIWSLEYNERKEMQ